MTAALGLSSPAAAPTAAAESRRVIRGNNAVALRAPTSAALASSGCRGRFLSQRMRTVRQGKRMLPVVAGVPAAAAAAKTATLTLSSDHGFVGLSLLAAVFVHNFFMNFKVVAARKKYSVPYPALYDDGASESSFRFNCVQRGHQNSLENYPMFLALLILAGIPFPITAAISGAVYSLGKLFYFVGYSTGDPNKRLWGSFSYFGLFTLIGCVAKFSVKLITM